MNSYHPHLTHYVQLQVEGCPKTYPHNWQECPCAHAGEVARRRDVRIYKYSSQLCAYVKAVSHEIQ